MSSVAEAPTCTVGYTNGNVDTGPKAVPCGKLMRRAGSETVNFLVCPACDPHIGSDQYLDPA